MINRRTKYTGREPVALDRLLDEEIAQRAPNDGGLPTRTPMWERIWQRVRHVTHVLREILYGMTTFEWARDMQRERGEVERLFVLITFGDLIGLPLLPPYYTLRLLPYVVPAINRWKRSLLRERDWTDLTGLIEGVD